MTDDGRSRALAELLATPLGEETSDGAPDDDTAPPTRTPWGVLVSLIVGAAIVFIGFVIADDDVDTQAVATTTLPPTSSPPAALTAFPAGYTPIDDATAIRVVRVGVSGEDLAVTLTSVMARNLDAAASTPFTGGRWSAVLRNGSIVPALGQIVDDATPGVVTALFDPDEVPIDDLVAIRISERWFEQRTSAIQELAVDGLPWTMPESALVDLSDGTQLVVNALELSETGGVVEWSLVGDPALGVVSLEIALEEGFFDGQPRMVVPIGRIDRFFFDPATAVPEGRIELSGPTAAGGTGIARGFAYWSVDLTVTAPATAEIPVPEIDS